MNVNQKPMLPRIDFCCETIRFLCSFQCIFDNLSMYYIILSLIARGQNKHPQVILSDASEAEASFSSL